MISGKILLMRHALLFLACLLAVAMPVAADTHPNLQRGFAPEKAFQVGDVDHVNLFNGSLTLTLPIGGSYPVGGGLSYGLTLVYNSNPWDFIENCYWYGCFTAALPHPRANAGFGWTLSFGRLEAPQLNDSGRWLYVGPDAAEHPFFDTLHEGETASPGVHYTRDGSYLRMKEVGGGICEVERPGGEIHRFGADGELTQIRDRFGNFVNLAQLNNGMTWQIQDSHGRMQWVDFVADAILGKRISTVTLTAFGGTTATYTFGYTTNTVVRPCPHTDSSIGNQINVNLLASVTLPDGSSYSIPEYYLDQSAGCRTPGAVKSLVLPTLGKIAWTYQLYGFPTGSVKPGRNGSNGVATRTLYDAAGTLIGQWQYTTELETVTSPAKPQQLLNTVTTPLGHRSEHFFSVSYTQATSGWNIYEYGLPLTHHEADATGTRFLSTREYGTGNVLLRSTYVRYERDAGESADPAEATKLNQRLASTRTVYEDDGGRFADSDFSDFDGLGHYRTVQTNGNFDAGNVRSATARYNPARGTYPGSFSMLPVASPWVLETFDLQEESEGGVTARQTFVVDAATGWVSRRRIHRLDTGAESSQDVIVETLQDGLGNLASERFYGGDTQTLGTGNLATLALPQPPQYGINYTTLYGTRATAAYTTNAGVLFSFFTLDCGDDPATPAFDPGIDFSTGLAAKCRDSSRIATSYEYEFGRLRFIKPEAGHDGWTEYVYTRATGAGALAQVQVLRRPNGGGTALAESLLKLDAFGRVWQEQQKMPNGTFSIRETLYNAMGWKASVSEQGDTDKKTEYLSYDRFGRPATVRPPDGSSHDITFTYTGVRSVARAVKVGTSYSAGTVSESTATTTEVYDRQGRLYQVQEPAEANGTTTTTYTYDVGNRLTRVQQATSLGTQNRWFTYDQRGFLLSEQHPEKGASGNGTVTYSNYDARGHAGTKVDGAATLTFVHDRAERLVSVSQQGVGPLKAFTYGNSNAAGVRTNGRLETATRYNYVSAPFNATVQVVESYTYGGRQGRVSQKNTLHVFNGVNKETFVQSYTYNALGAVASLSYPACTYLPSCPTTVTRTVTFTYTNGLLTAVPGFATAINYHSNGLYNQITHANGVTDTQANDANSMRRPGSLSAASPQGTLWSSGTYRYDGAGNVVKTGNSYFLYDRVSRLVDGHVYDSPVGAGNLRSQTYTYDPYGNLTAIGGDAWAPGRTTPTAATTNRLTSGIFDAAGNMTAWSGNSYEYDGLGMMTRMLAGAEDWRYIYTADDERFWAYRAAGAGPGSIWTLRDLDGKVLRQYDAHVSWTQVRDYIYRDGQLLASNYPGEGDRHFSLDHLGTPRLVTASASAGGFYTLPPAACSTPAIKHPRSTQAERAPCK